MTARTLSLTAMLFLLSTTVHATQSSNVNTPQQQIAQTLILLDQLQQSIKNTADTQVYLGTTQLVPTELQQKIDENKNQLGEIAKQLNQLQSVKTVAVMKWLPAGKINNKDYMNVDSINNPVYICRAEFIGANPGSKATYPGTLTPYGCRISYAGYAFISATYDVLSGSNAALRWVPIAQVDAIQKHNAALQAKNTSAKIKSPIMPNYNPFRKNIPFFDFDIKIDNKMAVAGGYQDGNPVLICKTKQNNITYIGKVVFFVNENSQQQQMEHACDIGVGDKEVVIAHQYDVLFSS